MVLGASKPGTRKQILAVQRPKPGTIISDISCSSCRNFNEYILDTHNGKCAQPEQKQSCLYPYSLEKKN